MNDHLPTGAVDSHIHWFPPAYCEMLSKRTAEPRAERRDGYWSYLNGNRTVRTVGPEWVRSRGPFRDRRKDWV